MFFFGLVDEFLKKLKDFYRDEWIKKTVNNESRTESRYFRHGGSP
jgi:hypothetical protein